MLLSELPLALIDTAGGPPEGANAVLLACDVVTLVAAAIRPACLALAVHLVLHPLPMVLPAINPAVYAMTVLPLVLELTFVGRPVGEVKMALLALAAVQVASREAIATWPSFTSLTMLLIIQPLSFVLRSTCAAVNSVSTGHIPDPLTLIDVTTRPNQFAMAIPEFALPLAHVSEATLILIQGPFFALQILTASFDVLPSLALELRLIQIYAL
mmetsp:Transcript_19479/g.42610  ORF Transcript_19479/g.42610 Transcript_19479/m.42610 type:complete len:213 (-) Transcript_19479:146-784(-)